MAKFPDHYNTRTPLDLYLAAQDEWNSFTLVNGRLSHDDKTPMTHTHSARTPTKSETHTLHNDNSVAKATSEQSPKHATTYLFCNKYEQLHFIQQPLNGQLVAK